MNPRILAMLLVLTVGGVCSADAPTAYNDDRKNPLEMIVLEPSYNNCIYSSTEPKRIVAILRPSIHILPGLFETAEIVLEMLDKDNKPAAQTTVGNIARIVFGIRCEIDVKDVPAGDYTLKGRMIDRGKVCEDVFGNSCVASTKIRILPPAPQEVVIDSQGICQVNGKPFFPIALGHIWPGTMNAMNSVRKEKGQEPLNWRGWYGKLKQSGFNSFMDWQDSREPAELLARYDIAAELGFRAIFHPNSERDIKTLKDHPGVLTWYAYLEVHNSPEETIASIRKRYLELDPYHPQMGTDTAPEGWHLLTDYADIIGTASWPRRGGDLRIAGNAVAACRKLVRPSCAVWPVIQAFQLSNYASNPDGSPYHFERLTEEEMRCTVYDSLACGAKGLYYYTYWVGHGPHILPDGSTRPFYVLDDFPDQWEAMTRINHELQQIIPAILSGVTLPTTVKSRDDQVHAATFVEGARAILVVANPTAQQQHAEVSIAGIGSQTGGEMFSQVSISVRAGRVRLDLAARDVGVFEFGTRVSPDRRGRED